MWREKYKVRSRRCQEASKCQTHCTDGCENKTIHIRKVCSLGKVLWASDSQQSGVDPWDLCLDLLCHPVCMQTI